MLDSDFLPERHTDDKYYTLFALRSDPGGGRLVRETKRRVWVRSVVEFKSIAALRKTVY